MHRTPPGHNMPGHPDPARHPGFYDGLPTKRLAAWLIDWVLSAVIASFLLPLTLFIGILFFPVFVAIVGFFYRWATLSGGSATLGMRLMGIQMRDRDGLRFDSATAFWHTALHYTTLIVSPGLLISAALTVFTPKKQGLHDLVLGTTALNRPL